MAKHRTRLLNLQERLNPTFYDLVRRTSLAILRSPDSNERTTLIQRTQQTMYPGLQRIFVSDDKVYLSFQDSSHRSKTAYVCDWPDPTIQPNELYISPRGDDTNIDTRVGH